MSVPEIGCREVFAVISCDKHLASAVPGRGAEAIEGMDRLPLIWETQR